MKTRFFKAFFIVLFVVLAVSPILPVHAAAQLNITPTGVQTARMPAFSDFVKSVTDGANDVIRGVYVPYEFAFRVIQQRSGNYGYVSVQADAVTQFALANKYDVTGLLAHNYLAGSYFYNLAIGQEIRIVYGDGRVEYYEVSAIYQYQAVSPLSTTSNFIDLATNTAYTANQVFDLFYTGGDHLTFQTCIAKMDISSWGRLFIVAVPLDTRIFAFLGN